MSFQLSYGGLDEKEFFSGPAEFEVVGYGAEDAHAEAFDHGLRWDPCRWCITLVAAIETVDSGKREKRSDRR